MNQTDKTRCTRDNINRKERTETRKPENTENQNKTDTRKRANVKPRHAITN